jgi:hypothetical protein
LAEATLLLRYKTSSFNAVATGSVAGRDDGADLLILRIILIPTIENIGKIVIPISALLSRIQKQNETMRAVLLVHQ